MCARQTGRERERERHNASKRPGDLYPLLSYRVRVCGPQLPAQAGEMKKTGVTNTGVKDEEDGCHEDGCQHAAARALRM